MEVHYESEISQTVKREKHYKYDYDTCILLSGDSRYH